ncbi:MAG: hypothetical protein Q8P93_04920 [bacterium]|nr:hypothetical protein [bacterium]
MKTIELIGTSGSGKTTAAKILQLALVSRGVNAVDPTEATRRALMRSSGYILRMFIRFSSLYVGQRFVHSRFIWGTKAMDDASKKATREFASLLSLIDHIAKEQRLPIGDVEKIQRWFKELTTQYVLHREWLDTEVVVWEEGFALRAITLFQYGAKEPTSEMLTEYIKKVPVPDGVVDLAIRPETAYERMIARKKLPNRMKGLTAEKMQGVLVRAREVATYAICAYRARGINTYTIDTNKDRDIVARSLEQLAETLVRMKHI